MNAGTHIIPAAMTFAMNNPIQNAGEAINMILVLIYQFVTKWNHCIIH